MGWYDFLVFSKFGAKDLVAMPTSNTPTVVRIDRRNPISISVSLSLRSFANSSELKAEGTLSLGILQDTSLFRTFVVTVFTLM